MATLICEFKGVRGRIMKLYDTKIVIITKKTIGSFITGNITDGEKTIFLTDIVGVQHKKSGLLIGYLQFETPSMQMNNKNHNMFSENTFTYELSNKHGITNELIEAVYKYIVDRLEELKFGTSVIKKVPDFKAMKANVQESANSKDIKKNESKRSASKSESSTDKNKKAKDKKQSAIDEYIDAECPECGKTITVNLSDESIECPWCNTILDIELD